ncbi:hypothetical protein H1P_320022 [Hyella patelloides LEGE 07179]|uniref:Uncharacterized protein n=1 Tax=Hyella patelloides LEGE 07179 TaxID=945734 RepID=A0A563VVE6_9CYAN|nr:hypothetical protein H1P_320022 [Hyella patelloides LEGE 07179]
MLVVSPVNTRATEGSPLGRSFAEEASAGVDRGDFSGFLFCLSQLTVVC